MYRSIIMAVLITVLILAALTIASPYADTIYSWTDSEGVQRFTNEPPPPGAENVKTFESSSGSSSPPAHETATPSANRRAFEQMVEEARSETQQLERERRAREAAAAAEKKRRAEYQRQARVDAERRELQQEIDAINARGLSRTFSQGMKESLIKKVQERIDMLEKNPEEYFNVKQETSETSNTY